ncbi:TPA: SIR2 family protein [Enterococcus faecium]|nr:hypothetical protein [Enterococcus faecium]
MDKHRLINDFSKNVIQGNAAIFLGAGLSVGAKYKDWKELLKEPAESIGLNVEKEQYDLISLAEYIKNERNRTYINEILLEEFFNKPNINPTDNHRLLASLPIDIYWTTNYDDLMEKALQDAKKPIAVKRKQSDLSIFTRDQEAVVYKMHGDISDPNNAILTRTDYEMYDTNRVLFKEALEGQVVTRTFLFIGFSFTDPNLERMLARIRHTLKESSRTHYCIMKNINKDAKDYDYQVAKLQLQINDLKNYHVETVLIDDYDEITQILSEISNKTLMNSILISGSAIEYGDFSNSEANQFVSLLTQKLLENNFKIVNGFGLGIGHAVVNGALEYRDSLNLKGVGSRLDLRPFPFQNPEKFKTYREEFISDVGIVISIFGNQKDGDSVTVASGVKDEARIAKEKGKVLFPIPLTGYAAKEIYDEYCLVDDSQIDYSELMEKDDKNICEIVDTIVIEANKLRM